MPWNMIIPGVVLLGIVIFVHELGHFLAAKWRGVRVLRFALGFGPPIVAVTRGETEYRICWVPLGGYVQMAGDSPGEDGRMPGGPEEFLSHPWYGRIIIALAGPFANLVLAFIVLGVVGMLGVTYSDFPNRLGATPDSSQAYKAGLREGDQIVSVAGKSVSSWVPIFITNSKVPKQEPLEIGYERAGARGTITLTSAQREPVMSSLRRPSDPPVVGNVALGMPAYQAGLQAGDRIRSADGVPITVWEDLQKAIRPHVDQPVKLEVERGGHVFDVTVKPLNADGSTGGNNGVIGIEPPRHGDYVQRVGVLEAWTAAGPATVSLVGEVYRNMWLTLTRFFYYKQYLGGPLFIAQAAGEQMRRGLDSYLLFMAWINVAIMAFNLLPLPVLDGGHILLALVEAVRRQALSARAYLRFQQVGLIVIGALFVFILANDPWRLFQRHRALQRTTQETPVAPPP